MSRSMLYLVAAATLVSANLGFAEPWLGNRFAQNCAGCHAPGRKNLPPAKRRCTLACQGCHVSPQGSGLRSQYGKWTEDRWLKSFRFDELGHKKSTAPYPKQLYADEAEESNAAKGKGKGNRKKPGAAKKKNYDGIISKRGALLVETNEVYPNEDLYNRRDRMEHIESKSRAEFEYQVAAEDPYREMLATKIDGGADLRWQVQKGNQKISNELGDTDVDFYQSFLMNLDLGVRWRPIHKKVHLVYEGRATGNPKAKKLPQDVGATLIKRNLYLLVDDLPFATYFQAGYYRPIFGNPHPDHTLLAQRMISLALQDSPAGYNLYYQSYSVGGSPNVPYANLSIIGRQFGAAPNETTKGLVFNGGGRFVTLGLSVNYSYWRSTREVVANGKTVESTVEMNHIGFGGQFGPVTATIDGIAFNKDVPNQGFYSGGVWQIETYSRFWRENYFVLGYHFANVADTLVPGSASQLRVGVRSFVMPGVDVQIGTRQEAMDTQSVDERTSQSSMTWASWVAQLHLYM